MKKISLLLIVACIYACGNVPVTGRKQLMLVSDSEVLTLSLDSYNEYMKTAKKSTDRAATDMVMRVGVKIASAVEYYYESNGMTDMLKNFAWEFNLVEDANVNAFCMPGGKIVVYTGILPVTKDETGLAVVLGHEVAHAVAKHANERMSQQMVAQYGSTLLSSLLSGASDKVKSLGEQVYGLGAQYGVMLPFGRKQELEADHLGLIFMAIAGYNPEAAVPFWQRMSQTGEASTPEFFSTHPSHDTRIEDIQKELPEAMEIYNAVWKNDNPTNKNTTTKPSNTRTDENWHF